MIKMLDAVSSAEVSFFHCTQSIGRFACFCSVVPSCRHNISDVSHAVYCTTEFLEVFTQATQVSRSDVCFTQHVIQFCQGRVARVTRSQSEWRWFEIRIEVRVNIDVREITLPVWFF